jgi:hypothetical protein
MSPASDPDASSPQASGRHYTTWLAKKEEDAEWEAHVESQKAFALRWEAFKQRWIPSWLRRLFGW